MVSINRSRPFSPIAAALFATLFCALLSSRVQADIGRSFNADIHIHRDTSFEVTETIQVDFENASRHGIYRDIPVSYQRNGGNYTIYLTVQSVTDGNGRALTYKQSRQGRNLEIKIGDANVTVTGVQTYRISYYVRRAVNWFDNKPEFYWNVCGNGWQYPLQNVTANFYPPTGVTPEQLHVASYTGPTGSQQPAQVTTVAGHLQFSTASVEPGGDLTLVVGFPAGVLTRPSALQVFFWLFADWWAAFVLPLLAAAVIFWRYLQSGRDVDGGLAAGVEWNPPKELSPAEVGTLVDERCDMQDIVSTLVDLAARGYLLIEELKSTKFLFLSSTDYRFTRLDSPVDLDHPLAPHETEFLQGVFGSAQAANGNSHVLLSSLKEKFYTHLPAIRTAIYASLTEKGLFNGNPNDVRNTYIVIAVCLLVAGFGAAIIGAAAGAVSYGIGIAVAGVIVAASARAMPSKTAKGSRLLRECLGFQRFVSLAEKDRIAVLAKDDPTIFGRLLPYAMVLGVADHWATAFKDLMKEPPDWYRPYGYGPGYVFMPNAFVNDLGGGMNTMGSTFASQPQSTGGGGGSGFSGGGSGGGFGGGGGGSW